MYIFNRGILYKESFKSIPTTLIVVARYNEKLEWLKEDPFSKHQVIVYNKGVNEDFYHAGKVVPLKNLGREGHTYLHHIVKNYDNLHDITIFLPGSSDLPRKIEKTKKMVQRIDQEKKAVFITESVCQKDLYHFTMEQYCSTSPENKSLNSDSTIELSKIRPFGKWFEEMFCDSVLTHVSYCGILSVSKKDVLQHPKSYYENLLKQLSYSSNPEVGHYVERSWQAIFSMKDTMIV